MLNNRSMPCATVIPELAYPNVGPSSTDWLRDAFGFTLRLRIGDHRAQLNVGDGAVVVTEQRWTDPPAPPHAADTRSSRWGVPAHAVMVRVEEMYTVTTSGRFSMGPASCARRTTIRTANGNTPSRIMADIAGRFRNRSPTPLRKNGVGPPGSFSCLTAPP